MLNAMNRRNFLQLGVAAGAAAVLARAAKAQDHVAARRTTPIKTTKLYENVYLLQGEGGNMALQTGREGNILIDASLCSGGSADSGGHRRREQGRAVRADQYALARRPHGRQ